MNTFKTLTASLALLTLPMSLAAMADEKSTVQVFYDFLSNPGSEAHASAFEGVVSEDWESIGDYSGKAKTSEELIGQMAGFAKLIPDLNWAVEEMIEGEGRVVVRSRATGTPDGPLFGVDGQGKSFEIMTIDIHTLEDGKITRTYHVEDWAGALRQLGAQ